MDILRPLTEQAQGTLSREDLDAHPDESEPLKVSPYARSDSFHFSSDIKDQKALPKPEKGNVHLALFFMLLVFAVSHFIDIYYQHPVKNLLDSFSIIPFVLLSIVAIRKQSRSDFPAALKAVTWTSLIVFTVSYIFFMFFMMFYQAKNPGAFATRTPMHVRLEDPFSMGMFTVMTCIYLTLGTAGLVLLNRYRATHLASQGASPIDGESDKGD